MYLLLVITSLVWAAVEDSIIALDMNLRMISERITQASGVTVIPLANGKTTLYLEVGDITKKNVDAIVNAANPKLKGGDGVCGAIFAAAGSHFNDPRLQDACNAYPADKEGVRCPVGEACVTDSFELAKRGIKKIIHAVGPNCDVIKNREEQSRLLRNAYDNSLKAADELHLTSIAFPFISSGIYNCLSGMASIIPLQQIEKFIDKNSETTLQHIYIVLFTQEDKKLFDKQVRILRMIAS